MQNTLQPLHLHAALHNKTNPHIQLLDHQKDIYNKLQTTIHTPKITLTSHLQPPQKGHTTTPQTTLQLPKRTKKQTLNQP